MTISEPALGVQARGPLPSDLVRPDRIHRSIYLDEDLFKIEMEKIFNTTWIYVGHESEVANPGDYKTAHIGLQPVILARHEDNELYVMLNRCTHRAATVCQEAKGNSSYFRCEYHGWMFKNDGQLVNPTFSERYEDTGFDKADFALPRAPRVDSYRGMVFASLKPEGESLVDFLGNAAPFIDLAFDLAPEGTVSVNSGNHKYSYAGNWKFQSENGVDGYHPNFTHKAFFEATGIAAAMNIFGAKSEGRAGALGNGHGILDSRPMMREFGKLALNSPQGQRNVAKLAERLGSTEKAEEVLLSGGTGGFNLLIYPNILMIGNQIRVVNPRSVLETDVDIYPYLLDGATDEQNEGRLRSHEEFYGAAGGGGPDDVEMFRRVFTGLNCEGFPGADWLDLSRGFTRSVIEDGIEWGHVTDEVPQRGYYRKWLEDMEPTGSEGS